MKFIKITIKKQNSYLKGGIMLRRFGLRPRYAALAALVAVTGMLMISSCSKSSPTQVLNNTNSWAFTATVLDGYTGSPIPAAKVSYKTIENKDSTVLTSSLGSVRIEGLAPAKFQDLVRQHLYERCCQRGRRSGFHVKNIDLP